MLEKQITYDHFITEDGIIQVKRITRILEDGKELSKSYHRHTISPLDNIEDEDDRTKLLATVIYTPEFIAKYKEKMKIKS